MRRDIHAPPSRAGVADAFLKASRVNREAMRIEAKRNAMRIETIMADAQARARAELDKAHREAEKIFSTARAEAEAILARLPDFDRIEKAQAAEGKSAYRALRDVADRYGLPLAVVVGRARHQRADMARQEAIRAVLDACPMMSDLGISALFDSVSPRTVKAMREGLRSE